MTAQKGRDLLLKIDTTGAGAFQTVAGLRANALSFNAESVDVSHQESAGAWRELLAGAGIENSQCAGARHLQGCGIGCNDPQLFLQRHHQELASHRAGFRNRRGTIPDHGTGDCRDGTTRK